MIVYLFKKSKSIIKYTYIGSAVLLGTYSLFVFKETYQYKGQTIQIIKVNTFGTSLELTQKQVLEIPKPQSTQAQGYAFVASSRGKYYYSKTCSRAQTLSTKNMLYFKDKMSVEAAGYRAHLAC